MADTLIVGNSDGIGLEVTRRLLEKGRTVFGISRSASPLADPRYTHLRLDVTDPEYRHQLRDVLVQSGTPELCLYCAGVGYKFDLQKMERESQTLAVNLMGFVYTVEEVLPGMKEAGKGHFIGLSSVSDVLRGTVAPAYGASKAGMTFYMAGLQRFVRPYGIRVTNVRFGYVDTKLAKARSKPLMLSVDEAARDVLQCIERKPRVLSRPRVVAAAAKVMGLLQ